MAKKTNLELACEKVLGKEAKQIYFLLSELLILNPRILKKNDTRFSAQLTLILFDDKIEDKVSLICQLIDENEYNLKTNIEVIDLTKSLLELDPDLEKTKAVINELKNMGDPNYSQIMRKVDIKHSMKLYFMGESYTPRRI
ncbi:MAG: hypothetical protein K9W42_05925 [Candidatus Heimdallarchaeota archaeon]|nr:hypothetical protein [Candidatus Heimdallarchaeota archaeon]